MGEEKELSFVRREPGETPLKLCNEISRLFHEKMREDRETDSLLSQPGSRGILNELAKKDGLCQQDLVNRTRFRAPSISVALRKMEEDGIVKRKSDPKDQRVTRVYLTEKGRQTDRKIVEKICRIDAVALNNLSDEENALLMALLGKVRDNLLREENPCESEVRE